MCYKSVDDGLIDGAFSSPCFFFSKMKLYYHLQYFFDFNSFINYIFFFYATTVDLPLYYYQKLVYIVFTLEMRRRTPPHDIIIYYWNSIPSVLLSYIIRILYTNTMILYPREFVLHASRGDNNVNNYYYLVYHCHIVCATL
jgi:hypothetical protein